MNILRITVLLVTIFITGCGSDVTPIITCEQGDGLTPVCGFQNPEDMARIADTDWIIVSQFGLMDGSKPGNLALFERNQETLQVVFPAATNQLPSKEPGWGEADCLMPGRDFSPHGLDLHRLDDGRFRLLVVNHGGRESIEFFEVFDTELPPEIIWRGCVLGPSDAYFNDVVNLSDGAFLVTHMMPKSAQFSEQFKAILGFNTGYVLQWLPAEGFSKVEGTDGPFPNGIEVSADEEVIYLSVYMAGEVRKIRRSDGALLATAEVTNPDNITWGSENRLLVASHTDSLIELLACQDLERGACGFGFEIVSLNPDTMEPSTLLSHRGAPMGAATVALQIGNRLYLGSFAGDRIVYTDLGNDQ